MTAGPGTRASAAEMRLRQPAHPEVARARQIAEQARSNERASMDEQIALERNAAALR